MILARRILPFVAPLGLAVGYIGMLAFPQTWKVWAVLMAVLIIAVAGFMMQWRILIARFWMTMFPVAMLLIGGTGLLFFLRSSFTQWALALFLVVMYGLYLEDVFTLNYQQYKYTSLSLPNIAFFMNTTAGFCLFASAFAMNLIGLVPVWMITTFAFCFSATMMFHVFWTHNIWDRKHALTIVMLALVVTELVWVLQFWPTAFFVNGVLVAIVLYAVPSIVQLQIRNALSRQALIRYVSIAVLLIASVVTTSQWS